MLASILPRSLVTLAASMALACLANTPAARAQVTYAEPPDLTSNPAIPTPVGTVAAGQNTVTGTAAATSNTIGIFTGDAADAFSFIVPPDVAVTGIQIVISNFTISNCFVRARSFSNGIDLVDIGGNGTFTMPVSGLLGAGTYNAQISMGPILGDSGSCSFSYQFRITAIPATNDSCQFAAAIPLGATAFNNSSATDDGLPHETACSFFNSPSIARDLWYTFTPTLGGLLTVSTCGSMFDTEVNVYDGNTCPGTDGTLLACNDDNPACGIGSINSQVVVTVVAGQSYLIRVGGYDGSTVDFGPGTLTLGQVSTGGCCNRWTGHCTVRDQLDCTSQGLRFDGFGSTCSPATCTACPADFNGGSGITPQDIFDFLNAWFAGC